MDSDKLVVYNKSIPENFEKSSRFNQKSISFYQWTTQDENTCQYIQELKATKIQFEGTSKKVLTLMKHVNFSQLKQIWLLRNKIESVEFLCKMQMPNLKFLNLGGNQIVWVKALRKGYWPDLLYLFTYNIVLNFVNDGERLAEMKLHKLQGLGVEYDPEEKDTNVNISWLLKLQTKQLKISCTSSKRRIQREKISKMMLKKHKQIKLNINPWVPPNIE